MITEEDALPLGDGVSLAEAESLAEESLLEGEASPEEEPSVEEKPAKLPPPPAEEESPICKKAITAAAITAPRTLTISGMTNLFTGRC